MAPAILGLFTKRWKSKRRAKNENKEDDETTRAEENAPVSVVAAKGSTAAAPFGQALERSSFRIVPTVVANYRLFMSEVVDQLDKVLQHQQKAPLDQLLPLRYRGERSDDWPALEALFYLDPKLWSTIYLVKATHHLVLLLDEYYDRDSSSGDDSLSVGESAARLALAGATKLEGDAFEGDTAVAHDENAKAWNTRGNLFKSDGPLDRHRATPDQLLEWHTFLLGTQDLKRFTELYGLSPRQLLQVVRDPPVTEDDVVTGRSKVWIPERADDGAATADSPDDDDGTEAYRRTTWKLARYELGELHRLLRWDHEPLDEKPPENTVPKTLLELETNTKRPAPNPQDYETIRRSFQPRAERARKSSSDRASPDNVDGRRRLSNWSRKRERSYADKVQKAKRPRRKASIDLQDLPPISFKYVDEALRKGYDLSPIFDDGAPRVSVGRPSIGRAPPRRAQLLPVSGVDASAMIMPVKSISAEFELRDRREPEKVAAYSGKTFQTTAGLVKPSSGATLAKQSHNPARLGRAEPGRTFHSYQDRLLMQCGARRSAIAAQREGERSTAYYRAEDFFLDYSVPTISVASEGLAEEIGCHFVKQ